MRIHPRLCGTLVGLALVVGACGGASTPTASPAAPATEAASSVEPASPAPSTAAASTEPAGSGPQVSLQPGAATDLEAMLPDDVNGTTLRKGSFDGSSLAASGVPLDTGGLAPILKATGKTVADVRMAIGSPADQASLGKLTIVALQIRGVPAESLLPLFPNGATQGMQKATVGGKSVLQAGATGFSVLIYLKGDVLFYVLGADPTLTEAAVSKLP